MKKVAKTKEKLFLELIAGLQKLPASRWPQVAEDAGVCLATLYNWCYGSTFNPRLNTVIAVATALGYEVQLIKPAKLRRAA